MVSSEIIQRRAQAPGRGGRNQSESVAGMRRNTHLFLKTVGFISN